MGLVKCRRKVFSEADLQRSSAKTAPCARVVSQEAKLNGVTVYGSRKGQAVLAVMSYPLVY